MENKYFAKLDNNNIVVEVQCLNIRDCCDYLEVYSEDIAVGILKKTCGANTVWKQTTKADNKKFFARVGYSYNAELNVFNPPQPYASWTLNTDTNKWEAPITEPTPTDEEVAAQKYYEWDEDAYQSDNTQGWKFPVRM